jgi:hypothetical protein
MSFRQAVVELFQFGRQIIKNYKVYHDFSIERDDSNSLQKTDLDEHFRRQFLHNFNWSLDINEGLFGRLGFVVISLVFEKERD